MIELVVTLCLATGSPLPGNVCKDVTIQTTFNSVHACQVMSSLALAVDVAPMFPAYRIERWKCLEPKRNEEEA